MKILIVDDDTAFLTTLVKRVLALGHEVRGAMSGSEAFRVVQTGGPFDAIITDMKMRYGTGLDLIAQLYLENLDTPCRLHSAEAVYYGGGSSIILAEAVKKYEFASFALKSDSAHVETFLLAIEAVKK